MGLVCIHCRALLSPEGDLLSCEGCGARFPCDGGIADFAEGVYYDSFDPSRDELTAEHLRGLELEIEGSVRRIRDFYAPLIRAARPSARRVLDCGCGNGVSVDTLAKEGFVAWGNDVSQLRKWQWRERESRERLVVASGLRLPFPDRYFDVVISSGVLEHIGVSETPAPDYSVAPAPNQRGLRVAFLRELARVTAPGGAIFLDFPNGAFPIDFWHGNSPGSPRFHSLTENFLPTLGEVRSLVLEGLSEGARVEALSPKGRLRFIQSAAHLHGRLLNLPAAAFFRFMSLPGLRWLAGTAVNPFLVIRIFLPE